LSHYKKGTVFLCIWLRTFKQITDIRLCVMLCPAHYAFSSHSSISALVSIQSIADVGRYMLCIMRNTEKRNTSLLQTNFGSKKESYYTQFCHTANNTIKWSPNSQFLWWALNLTPNWG
jgi:hypothetical protein